MFVCITVYPRAVPPSFAASWFAALAIGNDPFRLPPVLWEQSIFSAGFLGWVFCVIAGEAWVPTWDNQFHISGNQVREPAAPMLRLGEIPSTFLTASSHVRAWRAISTAVNLREMHADQRGTDGMARRGENTDLVYPLNSSPTKKGIVQLCRGRSRIISTQETAPTRGGGDCMAGRREKTHSICISSEPCVAPSESRPGILCLTVLGSRSSLRVRLHLEGPNWHRKGLIWTHLTHILECTCLMCPWTVKPHDTLQSCERLPWCFSLILGKWGVESPAEWAI